MRLESVDASPGETVEVPLYGSCDFAVASLSFAVGHDTSRVTLQEVRIGKDLVDKVESTVPKVNNDAAMPYGALFVIVDDCCPRGDSLPSR
jgi:hypothetical protein